MFFQFSTSYPPPSLLFVLITAKYPITQRYCSVTNVLLMFFAVPDNTAVNSVTLTSLSIHESIPLVRFGEVVSWAHAFKCWQMSVVPFLLPVSPSAAAPELCGQEVRGWGGGGEQHGNRCCHVPFSRRKEKVWECGRSKGSQRGCRRACSQTSRSTDRCLALQSRVPDSWALKEDSSRAHFSFA